MWNNRNKWSTRKTSQIKCKYQFHTHFYHSLEDKLKECNTYTRSINSTITCICIKQVSEWRVKNGFVCHCCFLFFFLILDKKWGIASVRVYFVWLYFYCNYREIRLIKNKCMEQKNPTELILYLYSSKLTMEMWGKIE